ncbi:MAG: YceI family protein [Rhodomicrobium sp.]
MPVRAAMLVAFSLFTAGAGASGSHAANYIFDSKRAEVNFTYYVGFLSQSGHFTKLDGTFQFEPRSPGRGSINAVIRTASLTANAWESELRGSSFFNVAVFPEIRFTSRTVRATGENSAEFIGDLTMNGVTRTVTLQTVLKSGPHVTATAHLKRSAFNMTALGFLVGDDIDIQIEAELIEKQKSHRASD